VKAIGKARQQGKTNILMTEYFMKSPVHFLLVMNEKEKERLVREYDLSKPEQDRILIWATAREKMLGSTNMKGFYIDNVDDFLREIFLREPIVATHTGESQ